MARDEFRHEVTRALRDLALTYPEVNEGDSCVKRAFRARDKGFLYLGEKEESYDIMLKLGPSIEQARGVVAARPADWDVGGTNWVTLRFASDETPPPGLLEGWIDESYRIQASKKLVAELDAP